MPIEYFAWVGSFLLSVCGIPQLYLCIRQGHAQGLSAVFLFAWFFGEAFLLFYVWPASDIALKLNYTFNMLIVGALLFYRLRR